MTGLGQMLVVVSLLASGIIYGTDVFSTIVLRPALALVDDRTLVSTMGRVHDFGDRRLRVPGLAGIGTAIVGTAVLAWAGHLGATVAGAIAVSHWRSGSSFALGSVPPSTPGLPPPLNEEKPRLMSGSYSSDGTASSPHVPGCNCWPSWRSPPRS